ncbi:hypothetical protein BHM03_00038333 [Ensete ventricosum]|nr:hypothetical protein BHM03_00038333 [Ensete ventricosum]
MKTDDSTPTDAYHVGPHRHEVRIHGILVARVPSTCSGSINRREDDEAERDLGKRTATATKNSVFQARVRS